MLKKILNFFKRDTVLAVDFGSYSLKLAEFQIINNEPVLTGFVQARTYENALINGIINDEKLLRTNFKNLADNLSSPSKKIYLTLPYELVIMGSFKGHGELLEESKIKQKINDEIPYKIEDVYYSYYILPESEAYQIYYLVAKKNVIDKYIEFFNSLGYEVLNIDVDFANLHNLVEHLYGEGPKLIIDWGFSKIKLFFSDKTAPVYGRELFLLGLKTLKDKLKNKLSIFSEYAEKLMVNPLAGDRKEETKKIFKEYLEEVMKELEYGLDIAFRKYNLEVHDIFLVGGGARIPGIKELLAQKFDKEVKTIDIRRKIKIDESIHPDYFDIINTQGAVAVGIGIKDFI